MHRVLGVLHRVLGVLHSVLGVLHRVLGVSGGRKRRRGRFCRVPLDTRVARRHRRRVGGGTRGAGGLPAEGFSGWQGSRGRGSCPRATAQPPARVRVWGRGPKAEPDLLYLQCACSADCRCQRRHHGDAPSHMAPHHPNTTTPHTTPTLTPLTPGKDGAGVILGFVVPTAANRGARCRFPPVASS